MKTILFTNTIQDKYADALSQFQVTQIPFIEVKKCSIDYELDIEVEFPVIITSRNAMWAIEELKLVNNPLYVVGKSTAQKLEDKGYNVVAIGNDAFDLATQLPLENAYYLCGNLKGNAITDYYQNKHVTLYEVEVYETALSPHHLDEKFDAIVFLSPSAVRSYFENNATPTSSTLFSIGNTTALELSHFTSQEVIEANEATLPSLIQKIQEELS